MRRRIAKLHYRRPTDDPQITDPGQGGENIVLNAVRKKRVLFFVTEIRKWQHRDALFGNQLTTRAAKERSPKNQNHDQKKKDADDDEIPGPTRAFLGFRIDILLPDKSFTGKFVKPGQHHRDWKSDEQNDDEEAHRGIGDVEERKDLRRDLGDEPRHHSISHRRAINVATLQFGEKLGQIHNSGTLTFPLAFHKRNNAAVLDCRMPFQLESDYKPRGDQGQAIAKLIKSVEAGNRHQTLLGVTGSGKTFTIANVIRELDRPTLVISHNKTLAAQLYSEFKQFFPKNAVEYFVSYFDYYQPEAYIPRTDTYIEKDTSINEEIERLRLAATSSLLSRRDTIVVASVSCIYGVTSPEDYERMLLSVKRGQHTSREAVLGRLVDMLYERNDISFSRGKFRVRGDVVEVYPGSADEEGIRLEFFGDEID